jgi:HEAT repeat protein
MIRVTSASTRSHPPASRDILGAAPVWIVDRDRRTRAGWLAVAVLVGCAPAPVSTSAPTLITARLPAPPPADPVVPGAPYLNQLASVLQPKWRVFLDDCRLRLPPAHPLNRPSLAVSYDLALDGAGRVAGERVITSSGNGDFDTAAADVIADAAPLPAPPSALVSDDDFVHIHWQFSRDARQAGAGTSRVAWIELPLVEAVAHLLARGELARAASRVAAAPTAGAAGVDRAAAAELVMTAALREALVGPDGAAQRAAVEACGRARVHALAGDVRGLLAATTDPELRAAAIAAAGALDDRDAAPALLAALHDELVAGAPLAAARVAALVAIGRADDAAGVLRGVLDAGANPTALAALAAAPVPALARRLPGWAKAGDAATRAAVCAALPMAAPERAGALIARGLGDPDARVRATCAEAAGRSATASAIAPVVRRLRELARDRDLAVRARAIAALGRLDPAHAVRAVADPAPEVRAAFAAAASEAELRALAGDPAPEVRAAAIAAIGEWADAPGDAGDRAHALAVRAARDPAPIVRLAAASALARDADALAQLAGDASPEVARAALVQLAAARGRAAMTAPLLRQLVAAPAASAERARIALAWLLAS